MKNKILIVDDESAIREMIIRGLIDYEVVGAKNADEAIILLDEGKIDLVIVDVMMPGMNGFDLCSEIKRFYHLPVIMLTARGELDDKRTAFQAGTDDYVTKPFQIEELQFRVHAVLGRYQQQDEQVALGNVVLDLDSYEVNVQGQSIYLPRKEFELLNELMKISPKVATRDQLIEDIWGYDFDGDERTVDVHIKRLRKRLSAFDSGLEIITVRGIGYKVSHV